jgi:hypothetical protein
MGLAPQYLEYEVQDRPVPGYFRALYYPGHPTLGDEWLVPPDPAAGDWARALEAVGFVPEPGKGLVVIRQVNDCAGANPEGVKLELIDRLRNQVVPLYTTNFVPDPGREETAAGPNSILFLNVVPGLATVRVYPQGGGDPVSEHTLLVQADTLTTLESWPRHTQ